ncbi:hypothetical protein CQW23_27365 [Capsicum baccatum]|uniref:Uncharacterized protein n=1 Tax=Capsicum baccatum TaxID=33114 RepID=A0A2G2VDL4_CAPBA|nr:hypothetical protein CQW23_27365 [Capsicum baccatum]
MYIVQVQFRRVEHMRMAFTNSRFCCSFPLHFEQWSNGRIGFSIRKANSSWTQQKWSASPVQLDPNTWILEYSRSPLTENGKLVSAVLEFLKFRLRREVQKLKQEFWLSSSSFTSQYSDFTGERLQIPT